MTITATYAHTSEDRKTLLNLEGTVWIVWGESGEYEDHEEWPVCACLDQETAARIAAQAQKEENRIRAKLNKAKFRWARKRAGFTSNIHQSVEWERMMKRERVEEERVRYNKYDPDHLGGEDVTFSCSELRLEF